MIGQTVKHMYLDDEGLDCWYTGRVIGRGTTADSLLVEYHCDEDDGGIYDCPLLDDYLSHEVQFIS